MKTRNLGLALLGVLVSVLLGACFTTVDVTEIPQDLTIAQFFQKAQGFLDNGEYDASEAYLSEFRKRYPNEKAYLLEADYLSAQIKYKQKDYKAAKEAFSAILAAYQGEDAKSYPDWIRILSKTLAEKIDQLLAGPLAPSPAPGSASAKPGESKP